MTRFPTFCEAINFDEPVKRHQNHGFVNSSRCKARKNCGVKRNYKVRCNDEVEAQRRRWTFYESINFQRGFMPAESQKEKAIDLAVSQIERQFGKGAIMRLGTDAVIPDIPVISTGSLALDIALGIGGIPRGRVVEIFGRKRPAKPPWPHIVAEAQKKGGIAGFIDAEHALDVFLLAEAGRQNGRPTDFTAGHGEQALEIAEMLVRSGAIDVVVIDSVAALVPKAELEGEMGDAHMGLQARLMSQALRKLTATISKSNTSVIFINQIRMKIGVFMGNPETTTGGNALKFYSSLRLDIRRIGPSKRGRMWWGIAPASK